MGAYIQLEGNLGQNAEIGKMRDGENYIRFSLRQAHWKKIDDAFVDTGGFWMDCVWFTRNAEEFAEALSKGVPVQVIGDLRQDHWQDSRSGEQRSRFSVNARRVTLQLRGISSVHDKRAGNNLGNTTTHEGSEGVDAFDPPGMS